MRTRRAMAIVAVALAVLVAGVGTSAADSAGPPDRALVLVDVDAQVVPSHDPNDPNGTYPQGPAACQPQYVILSCGGLLLDLTFAGLDAHPRPPSCGPVPGGEVRCDGGTLQGTATIHHVVGCATPEGERVPELDLHVTSTAFVTAVLGQSRWVPPTGDVGTAHLQAIPPKAHPGHCPAGLLAAQWSMTFTDVVVTLTSTVYPSATYAVPGTWTWEVEGDGGGHPGKEERKAAKAEAKAQRMAEKAQRMADKAEEREQRKADR